MQDSKKDTDVYNGLLDSERSEERRVGKEWKHCQTLFFWAPKSLQMVIVAMKLKDISVHQPQASNIMHRTWTGDSFHI